jgi:hypothetical protein
MIVSSTDVVIIDGGIAGMTTAYILRGETGLTRAHITHALDDRYYNIEKIHGEQIVENAAESHTAAIVSITKEEKIDCEYEYGSGSGSFNTLNK